MASETTHPIDDENVLYTVTALHQDTRLAGTGVAETVEAAGEKAKDDLLKQLEEIGGC